MAIEVPSVTRLQDSLRKTRENFLRALDEGPDSLARFASLWCDLQSDIVAARGSSALDAETDTLINLVANDVSALVECFIGIEAASSSCHSRLISEACTVLDAEGPPSASQGGKISSSSHPSPPRYREVKPSLQPPRHPTTTPISSAFAAIFPSRNSSGTGSVIESTSSAYEPNSPPEFIEYAYKFFVTNIFNPYPTRQEKESIVDKTNNSSVTLTSISNWFTNARRRCGWTDILKRRCDGNRDEMIGLATRVFVKPDPGHPVDPQIISEFMDMKKNIESMYERRTRTSAWIGELEGMTELINPVSQEEQLAAKKRETKAEREARKRQRELLKEQRDLERRKQKMQAEALRKAEKVAKQVRREQAQEKRTAERVPRTPTEQIDEGPSVETLPSAGGKRKHSLDAGSSYDSSGPRHVSPAYSLSSAGDSDPSSDSRVPSLSWSDSSEERPYKRSRYGFVASSEGLFTHLSHSRSSSSITTYNHTSLSPALEVPTSFEYSFTFEPPTNTHAVFDSLFGFPDTSENSVATPQMPPRGEKRQYDTAEGEDTPRPKRAKPIVASGGPELAPAPSPPLFTPTPSVDETPMQAEASLAPVDLEELLGLDQTNCPEMENSQQTPNSQPMQNLQQAQNPQQVQDPQPDAPLPFEIDFGSFDWSACPDPTVDSLGASGEYTAADFVQLFQSVTEELPPSQSESHEQVVHGADMSLGIPSLDWSASLLQHPAPATNTASQLEESLSSDLSGLMSGLMSEQAFTDLGFAYPEATYPTLPDLSHTSSESPAWTSSPTTPPSDTVLTPAQLAEKALSKEHKRKALEEKKAALERERAKLAEMERELEDE